MIAAMILAAGESRRMGSPKALLPFQPREGAEQTVFLEHLVSVFARSRAAPTLVVLGHDAERIKRSVKPDALAEARVVVNEHYRKGMLSSIRSGIETLDETRVRGALICPVDHPDVDVAVVDELIARFYETEAKIVLPVHEGRRGHPVLFSRAVFSELLAAPESVGARRVVWDHQDELLEIKITARGVVTDIDTPEQYRAFLKPRPNRE